MSNISDSDYLKAKEIAKNYEDNYYNEIRNGTHKQFQLHSELGVICKCGKRAIQIRKNELFVCSSFTVYTCEYSKK
jgi:hypothetical protein